MALSDSRFLLRNIASPWKTSPRRATSSQVGQSSLRFTPPQPQPPVTNRTRRLLPTNLSLKFHDQYTSSLNPRETALHGLPRASELSQTIARKNIGNFLQHFALEMRSHSVVDPSIDSSNNGPISGYELIQRPSVRLGQGSFGTIFKAKYEGKRVAVKAIPLMQDAKLLSFQKEANALKLSHPNIVQIFKLLFTEDNYGIVIMELCYGPNLQTLLDDTTYNMDCIQIIKLAIDIASGIQYCHNNEILHLDIKPQNVIVCPVNVCKLCDFGNSHILKSGRTSILNIQNLGTLIYTDPDILQKRCATKQSDIYSYGITLWQLHSREKPYSSYNLDKQVIVYKVVTQAFRPRDFKACNKNEEDYINLYKRCWHKNSAYRPSSIVSVIHELKRIHAHIKYKLIS